MLFRSALDALHEGFMLFDASDRVVLANRKIYELFPHLNHMLAVGNSAETVFAQLAAERLPVATPEERARWLQRRLDEHRRATGAGVERDIDGRLFRITEIMCAGGYILTTYQDMTEVRGREHEEARKAALLQGILDCMAQGLVVVGKDLRIVASNRRAAELLSFPETLLSVGADFCDVIDASARRGDFGPGDPNVVATRAPERARTEISAQFERSLPTGRTLGVTVAPALGLGKVITYVDVSDRKRAEQHVQFVRHSIDRVSDCALWIRSDGEIADVNETAIRMLGRPRERLVGATVFDLFFDFTPGHWARMWTRAKIGDAFTRQVELRAAGGQFIPAEVSASLIEFDGAHYLCAFARDIRERVANEERLRQSQKMEALGQLAGGVAHEFNNVLMSVLGFAKLALKRPDDAERVTDCLNEVLSAAQRACDLTKQMLTFGRKQVVETKVLRVGETVRGLEKLLRTLIDETIAIDWQISDDAVCVEVDQTQFSQCIVNLAINARHAMATGGRLTLVVECVALDEPTTVSHGNVLSAGSYARISIADTGCGMSRETLQRIFEPFFTTKGTGKGTEIGRAHV